MQELSKTSNSLTSIEELLPDIVFIRTWEPDVSALNFAKGLEEDNHRWVVDLNEPLVQVLDLIAQPAGVTYDHKVIPLFDQFLRENLKLDYRDSLAKILIDANDCVIVVNYHHEEICSLARYYNPSWCMEIIIGREEENKDLWPQIFIERPDFAILLSELKKFHKR